MDLLTTTLPPESVLVYKGVLDATCVILAVGRVCATWRTKTKRAYAIHGLLFLVIVSQITGTIVHGRATAMERAIRNVILSGEWIKYMRMWAAEGLTGLEEIGAWESGIGMLFWSHFCYYSALCILKACYLVFYSQLFLAMTSRRIYFLYAAIAVWTIAYLSGFLLMFLWCRPLRYNWTIVAWFRPHDVNGRCPALFTPTVFVSLALSNLITDLFILAVPLSILTTMQFRRIEKVGLTVVFVVGFVSIAATIARLAVLAPKIQRKEMNWESSHTYAMLSHTEVAMGVIALCLPSYGGWLKRCFEKKWWKKDTEKKRWRDVNNAGVGGFGYGGNGVGVFTGDQRAWRYGGRPLVRSTTRESAGDVSLYESYPGWEAPSPQNSSQVEMGQVQRVRELV